jgi:preprotein translocase subunit SecE
MAKTAPLKFLKEVRQEVSKVTWPTRKETILTTAMVFVMVFILSLFFLLTDQIWSFSIKQIIKIGSGL